MSSPPTPDTKTSATGTGEKSTNITLGEGVYELFAASISHTQGEAVEGKISYIYQTGDGTEIEVILASGYASQYSPIVLNRTVILQGAGFLRSTCFHLTSMSHTFNAEYRRTENGYGVIR